MIWKKYGMIFNPQQYGMEYAKSPQAVVFDKFVRVYFSACKKDGQKLISYVCFADFTKDFSHVLRTRKQIISDGNTGCFDEHGIFPFSPFCDNGKIMAYTSGWSRRVSVSVDTAIGLAVSEDGGESFQRLGEGPVLTSSLMEPFWLWTDLSEGMRASFICGIFMEKRGKNMRAVHSQNEFTRLAMRYLMMG